MKRLLLLIAVVCSFTACNTPGALTKKGNKLSQQELYTHAADYYYQALQKKSDYTNAQIGLKNAGKKVINQHLDDFFKAKNFGDTKKAVYHYRDAQIFQQKVSRFKISLEIPAHYTNDYNIIVDDYVSGLYNQAFTHLEEENFNSAEKLFKEVSLLLPNYKDVKDLKDVATYEPKYRIAVDYLENEKFRASYYQFNKIPKSYKDTQELQNLALESGLFTIGLLEFSNATRHKGGEAAISAYISEYIMKLNNPFIKLIDRSHTNTLINEQLMGLSGQTTENTAAQAGELVGAKVILTGKLVNHSKQENTVTEHPKKGWYERKVKKYNEETEKHYFESIYDKIRYSEFFGSNQVEISFQFQLISTETGEILLTDIIKLNKADAVHFATANKNTNNIYPGNWKWEKVKHKSDEINTSYAAKRELRNLFNGKRSLKTTSQLSDQIFQNIAKEVTQKIDQYNPEQ